MRILDGENGTAAITRALIDMQWGGRRWSTVGASPNVIEASWLALVDAIDYGLLVVGAGAPLGTGEAGTNGAASAGERTA